MNVLQNTRQVRYLNRDASLEVNADDVSSVRSLLGVDGELEETGGRGRSGVFQHPRLVAGVHEVGVYAPWCLLCHRKRNRPLSGVIK
jgi:hypothetical protein